MSDNKKAENKKDSQLDESLKSIPVFTIALKGKIQKMPFKDEQVLLFFLDFDDAIEQLFMIQSQDEKANQLDVHPISMLDFLMIMQQTQQKEEAKIILRPHRNSINQIKLIAKQNNFEKLPAMHIPLFFARNKSSYMSIKSDNSDVIPMFMDPVELHNTLKKSPDEDMKIDIEFLESLLGKASKYESLKEQFVIVPSQTQTLRAQMLVQK